MTTDVVEPESFTYHESDSNPNSELELLQAGGRKPSRKTGRKTGGKMSRMIRMMRMM